MFHNMNMANKTNLVAEANDCFVRSEQIGA